MGFLHDYLHLLFICVIGSLNVYGTSQCEDLKRCIECVNTINCSWCPQLLQCRSTNVSCEGLKIANKAQCPQLEDNPLIPKYISTAVANLFNFSAMNLDKVANGTMFNCSLRDSKNSSTSVEANISGNQISCNMTPKLENGTSKSIFRIIIVYNNSYELDDDFNTTVTVYSCGYLGSDCLRCQHLNTSRYMCSWCDGTCIHGSCSTPVASDCPSAKATQIHPREGKLKGNTIVTISLANQPRNISRKTVWFGCERGTGGCGTEGQDVAILNDSDFDDRIITGITCVATAIPNAIAGTPYPVYVLIDTMSINSSINFTFQKPIVTNLYPSSGPAAGGSKIALVGIHLDMADIYSIQFHTLPPEMINKINNTAMSGVTLKFPYPFIDIKVKVLGDNEAVDTGNLTFDYLPDPVIYTVSSKKAFLSGGTSINITGNNFKNANEITLTWIYGFNNTTVNSSWTSTTIEFKVPEAPASVSTTVQNLNAANRTKRSVSEPCVLVKMTLKLDGVIYNFSICYFVDPVLNSFNSTVDISSDVQSNLTITGDYLDLAAGHKDFSITIGAEKCDILILNTTYLVCRVPMLPINNTIYPKKEAVIVNVGNIERDVGFIQYVKIVDGKSIPVSTAAAIGGSLFGVILIGLIIGIIKFRAVHTKTKQFTDKISSMEKEIIQVARQEFLDTNTSMQNVNRNLIQQGFPYHGYKEFTYNVIMAGDLEAFDPLVTSIQSKNASVVACEKGLLQLEQLLLNKFFLVSVIITLEKQKKFFIREKSVFTGYLCAILMGRMEYMQEIIAILLTDMMKQSTGKKSLKNWFRRCETITEQLVSNWMSLCLYPYLKSKAGSALYLLYMATLRIMENGPIDVITGDAKYTLCENKLMTKWNSSEEDHTSDLKFEAKHLTLNVAVDNCDECYKCQVLDCDTISQVKEKCLSQIYVNYPASQLQVEPDDVWLEWHEGFGGILHLRDEDSTSVRDGEWLRLNTLKHYNVKNDSNMSLRDNNAEEDDQQDYENLTAIKLDIKVENDVNKDSEPLTNNAINGTPELKRWHLVKPDNDDANQKHTLIPELYLNRLLTAKQGITEYLHALFDAILTTDFCPPPIKFLFGLLDKISEELKVDQDTLHSWKSHSYLIRMWATLIRNPSLLFDVKIPSYVDANIELISQCLIECNLLDSKKITKETPSQKLVFHSEILQYKDKVKQYFEDIKQLKSLEDFRATLTSVNLMQQEIRFNKTMALNMLYQQLQPYLTEIVDDLSTNDATRKLQLHTKFEEAVELIEEAI